MPCYHPITAHRTSTGEIVFDESSRHDLVHQLTLPCRRCIGCRLENARQWAMRCMHEASLYGHRNTFVTLTYADEHIPDKGSLRHADFAKFMKRLRKITGPNGVRFYMCGEYGRTNPTTRQVDGGIYRPHYHACLFGWDFADKQYWTTRGENKVYRSPTLERLWPFGQSELGTITFESAAYVAGYCTKKLTGPMAKLYGEREPEYGQMSRMPGIGKPWLEKYSTDVYPHDYVIVNGKEAKPPRYYDQLFEKNDPEAWRQIALERELDAQERAKDNTPRRLQDKEIVAKARASLKQRTL